MYIRSEKMSKSFFINSKSTDLVPSVITMVKLCFDGVIPVQHDVSRPVFCPI